MRSTNRKVYAFWILLCLGTGLLSGWLTREGTALYSQTITKPPLSPPAIVFPVVWTVLYLLMGISAGRVWQSPASPSRSRGLNLMVTQLVLNFFWSPIFFNLQAFCLALVWLGALWTAVLAMILAFRRADPAAAWLQLPYLLWLTFAAWLNAGVCYLNP